MEKKSWIIVIVISVCVTLVNAIAFIKDLINQPPNTVYMGMVHFFEDYFYYLNNFRQGAEGAWLVANRYTTEHTAPSFNYWLDLLMGKIGGVIGLSPVWSYNLWLILLVFITLIVSFVVIRKFLPNRHFEATMAFLFSVFATSIMRINNGQTEWLPIHEDASTHYMFDRLGSIPRHSVQGLIFYLLTLCVFIKPRKVSHRIALEVFLIILMWLLMITNPVIGGVYLGTVYMYNIIASVIRAQQNNTLRRYATPIIPWSYVIMLTAVGLIGFNYMNTLAFTFPHLQARMWEATQQTHPPLTYFLLSGGPIYVLALIGILVYILNPQPLLLYCVLLVAGTHLIYFSLIPNITGVPHARVLFSAIYPFIGMLAAVGARAIGTFVMKIVPWLKLQTVVLAIFILFFAFSVPTLVWELNRKIAYSSNSNVFYFLNYIPLDTYRGFTYLSNRHPYEDAVLAPYLSRTDLLIPALTGHNSYTGHEIETINSQSKNIQNQLFFQGNMSQEEARVLLRVNEIRYVVFTKSDGSREDFQKKYPFLTAIYTNPMIVIYRTP